MTNIQITPNFNLVEFHCKDGTPVPCSLYFNVFSLAIALQKIRDKIKAPIHVSSGYRTKKHNAAVRGAVNSLHLFGMAADISTPNLKASTLHSIIEDMIEANEIPNGGLGLYAGFVHYDIRGKAARWSSYVYD